MAGLKNSTQKDGRAGGSRRTRAGGKPGVGKSNLGRAVDEGANLDSPNMGKNLHNWPWEPEIYREEIQSTPQDPHKG